MLDLSAADAGDEGQVVIFLPLLLASAKELAEAAVLYRVGVRVGTVLDRGEEALAEPAVVREVPSGRYVSLSSSPFTTCISSGMRP